jgi:aldose sugar dehydrogenase
MFDVQVHPRYADNGWIYLSYAELLPGYTPSAAPAAGAGGGRGGATASSMTAIVRGRLRNDEWVDQQFIYHAPPALDTTDGSHFGSRFLFGRGGGDRGDERRHAGQRRRIVRADGKEQCLRISAAFGRPSRMLASL